MTFSASILELLDASVGAAHRDGEAVVVYVARLQPISRITRTLVNIDIPSTTIAGLPTTGRLIPPNVRASIMDGSDPGRGMTTTRGQIKIINPNERRHDRNTALALRGLFDNWRNDYAWKGQPAIIYLGPPEGTFPDDFEEYEAFTMASIDFELDEISIRPAAALTAMDEPVNSLRYGGGGIADGELLPLIYGKAYGIEPQVENSATEFYGVHRYRAYPTGPIIEDIPEVYEDGLAYTVSVDYAVNLATGTIDIVSPTDAIITADVDGAVDSGGTFQDRPGIIIQLVLDEFTDIAAAKIFAGSVAAYDTEFNYQSGYHFGQSEVSVEEFLAAMTAPLGYWYMTRDNQFGLNWLKHPAEETADLTLSSRHVSDLSIERKLAAAWSVWIGFQPIGRVLNKQDYAGAVTEAERARQSSEYRWVQVSDPNILELEPNARELRIETRFTTEADARVLAQQVFDIFRHPRQVLEADLTQNFLQYEFGDVVRVGVNRYDLIDDGFLLLESGDKLLLESGGTELTIITDGGDSIVTDGGDVLVTDGGPEAGDAFVKEESPDGTNFICMGYVDNPASSDFKVTLWG